MPKVRAATSEPAPEQRAARLGFLAAGHDPQLGYVAGLLITTPSSCPIEFHYVSPIRPTRTHVLLYGAELEPYIYRSLIVPALIGQTSVAPAFLITDQAHLLGYRPCYGKPILLVDPGPAALERRSRHEGAGEQAGQTTCCRTIQACSGFEQDAAQLENWLREKKLELDLAEPLQRVWEALRELARQTAQAA